MSSDVPGPAGPQGKRPFDPLALDIRMGMMKGFRLVHGLRHALTEEERQKIAEAIVAHLRLCNWRFEPGPPSVGGGALYPRRGEND